MASPSPAWRAYQRFWFDRPVAPEVMRLFRLVFFAVLALDLLLQISHASRYGAGGFNVSNIPALDGVLPVFGRPLIAALYLIGAYLAGLIAFGGGSRTALVALTAIWGAVYFSSQLDSYQHHYLVFLVLLVLCFVDWAPAVAGGKEPEPPTGGWPIRLVLVTLSIVYFYAAISKMGAEWRSGQVLAGQVSADWARAMIERMGGFDRAAKMVIATELFLSVALQVRWLRIAAAAIGIPFHAFVEASGFHIGLFSYFMFALYLLVLPEAPLIALVRAVRAQVAKVADRLRRGRPPRQLGWPVLTGAFALGGIALGTVPLGSVAVVSAAIAVAAGAVLATRLPAARRPRAAAAHLMACAAIGLLAQPALTDAARDYYRFWGGSARRLNNLPTAVAAYQRVVNLDPDFAQGHTSLANLYLRTGELDRAIAEAKRAEQLNPADHRPHLVEAKALQAAGRGAEAVSAAEQALARRPGDPEALAIARRTRTKQAPEPVEDQDGE